VTRLHRVTGGALEADLADVRVESVMPSNPDIDKVLSMNLRLSTRPRVLSPLVLVDRKRRAMPINTALVRGTDGIAHFCCCDSLSGGRVRPASIIISWLRAGFRSGLSFATPPGTVFKCNGEPLRSKQWLTASACRRLTLWANEEAVSSRSNTSQQAGVSMALPNDWSACSSGSMVSRISVGRGRQTGLLNVNVCLGGRCEGACAHSS